MLLASSQKTNVNRFRKTVPSKVLHLVFYSFAEVAIILSLFIIYFYCLLFSKLRECLKTMLH